MCSKKHGFSIITVLLLTAACLLAPVLNSQSALASSSWSSTGTAWPGYSEVPIWSLAYDSAHNLLYTGTQANGVWKYNGSSWKNTGGALANKRVTRVAYDSNHDILYAGCANDKVWKYKGGTWTSTGGITSIYSSGSTITALCYVPEQNLLYAESGNGNLWTYNGSTWTETMGPGDPYDFAYDPNHDILYASNYQYGVWKCQGGIWSKIWKDPNSPAHDSCAYDPVHNILYVGTGDGVWKYNGSTWKKTGGFSYRALSLTYDSKHNMLYAGGSSGALSAGKGVWKYNGSTWKNTGGSVSNMLVHSLEYDSVHNILYAGTEGYGVYKYGAGGSSSTGADTWYLAEGSTAWDFVCSIGVLNPNSTAVNVKVTYMTASGQVDGGTYKLPATSSSFLYPSQVLGAKDFSTRIACLEKKTIAVDRNMTYMPPNIGTNFEGHASVGVNAPAKQWYLPEGSSKWGFECWLLIQNPGSTEAKCNVTYMREGNGPVTIVHNVPAHSRETFNMAGDIGAEDASISVKSNVPVIPERAMYRNNRRAAHDSIGTTGPANDFYLAEGTTAWGFTTYVLIQNPQSTPNRVDITYMTPTGPKRQPSFTMPANSRATIRVNDIPMVSHTDLSIRVHGSKPLIAERSMFWAGGTAGQTAEVCHDSIGMSQPHKYFYLPSGVTGMQFGGETYTLVQNLNTSPVKVRVTYVTKDGKGNAQFDETIPAQSRKTFNMADKVPAGNYGIIVQSLTSGKKIMVERAMYWNSKGCGTDTIGGFED